MAKVNLMTMAAYARHRGVSKVAVGKAVNAGRISMLGGLIDPSVADVQWKANSRARANGQTSAQLNSYGTDQAGEKESVDDYMFNRNRREAAEAERAELSLAEDKGQLIRVDAVKAAVANVFSATRDALLQIPARLGPQLAAESDASKAQTMLYSEIHQALQLLAGASKRVGVDMVATP